VKQLNASYLWARLKVAYGRGFARLLDFAFLRSRPDMALVRIGTDYGGWYCARSLLIPETAAICCGAGEDVSFDVALNAEWGLLVLCVDPTPRAIKHVESLLDAIRNNRTMLIENGPATYQTKGFRESHFLFAPRAVWSTDGELDLFAPQNPEHVSYSALNLQHTSTKMRVRSSTLQSLIGEFHVGRLAILKLDIEGAEYEVIRSSLRSGVRPEQILIEFDQVNQPLGPFFWLELAGVIREICNAGYRLVRRERANYVFVREPSRS
jgi:FkbM family methyltransferase